MALLTVQNLSKSYPGFQLQNVSFSLAPGRIMGLIGKNGAGKSTTIKAMLNMVRPDGGEIYLLGQPMPQSELACKQQLGVALGGIDFYTQKRLAAITDVTRRFYPGWDEAAYRRYMAAFDLDEAKQIKQLSSGMRVKYLLALALSHGARLLILDEPTSGLDPVARDELLSLFRRIVQTGERSILFSTHITSDLDRCADDITYLQNGRVLASAEKTTFAASFSQLLQPGEPGPLSLEEIMLRSERRFYDSEIAL